MKTTRTSFLDLPPKLRPKIYRNLFVLETTTLEYHLSPLERIAYNKKLKASRTTTADPIVQFINSNAVSPQLLVTCKLCLHEGLPVLYGENELIFEKYSDLQYFIKLWSLKAKASIKTIIFKGELSKPNGLSCIVPYLNTLTSIRKFDS